MGMRKILSTPALNGLSPSIWAMGLEKITNAPFPCWLWDLKKFRSLLLLETQSVAVAPSEARCEFKGVGEKKDSKHVNTLRYLGCKLSANIIHANHWRALGFRARGTFLPEKYENKSCASQWKISPNFSHPFSPTLSNFRNFAFSKKYCLLIPH